MNDEQQPIADAEKVVILFLAIILDALSVIPGLGTIVAVLGLFSIGVWSWIRLGKMPLTKKLRKYVTKRAFIFLIEALPVAQIFPGWTVMALMGFRQGAKPSGGIVAAIAFITGITLLPGHSLALELTYPSFFPLQEGLQLNQLIELIFTASLVLGAITTFVSLIYTGFEYIVSGSDSGKRSEARKHIIATIIGMTILIGSIILLRVINPSLVTIPPLMVDALQLKAPQIVAIEDPSTEQLGADYSKIRISDNLNTYRDEIATIRGTDKTLLESIASLMEECSSSLCNPDPILYEYMEEYDCSYPDCSTDENGIESCDTIPKTCQRCTVGTCGPGQICVGEPLPNRESIAQTIQKASAQLNSLVSLSALATSGRNIIAACGERALSCTSLRLIGGAPSCDPLQDFFCEAGATPSASLPLREIADQEEDFIKNIKEISTRVLDATCSNTTFQCDGGCGVAKGQCAPSEKRSGCPPELFKKAEELGAIAENLSKQREDLLQIIAAADTTFDLANQTNGSVLLRSCGEARAQVKEMERLGIYSNGICPADTTCCPNNSVVQALSSCDPVDLFICS